MEAVLRPFESRIRDLVPGLERVYTDVDAHPELSMQEKWTAGIAGGFDVSH